MAMNRNMTMAEKEVRDYAQRQMERAEQWENILFTEEQKEQVLEYAAMTGDDYDIRKMVRDLADAVRSSDEENAYYNYQKHRKADYYAQREKTLSKITEIYHKHHGVDGYRSMQVYLEREGFSYSTTTVHKYMNSILGLKSIVRPKKPGYEHGKHPLHTLETPVLSKQQSNVFF